MYETVVPGWNVDRFTAEATEKSDRDTAHVDFPLCGAEGRVTLEAVREEFPVVTFLVDHVEVARLGRLPDEDGYRFNRRVEEVRLAILRTVERIGKRVI